MRRDPWWNTLVVFKLIAYHEIPYENTHYWVWVGLRSLMWNFNGHTNCCCYTDLRVGQLTSRDIIALLHYTVESLNLTSLCTSLGGSASGVNQAPKLRFWAQDSYAHLGLWLLSLSTWHSVVSMGTSRGPWWSTWQRLNNNRNKVPPANQDQITLARLTDLLFACWCLSMKSPKLFDSSRVSTLRV